MSKNHRPAAPAIDLTKKSSLFEVPIRVKSWGRWATLGLGLTAMLVGQMAGLMAIPGPLP
jgi:hypothetical protein